MPLKGTAATTSSVSLLRCWIVAHTTMPPSSSTTTLGCLPSPWSTVHTVEGADWTWTWKSRATAPHPMTTARKALAATGEKNRNVTVVVLVRSTLQFTVSKGVVVR